MQRLHHIFQRGALALALLTAGVGGGYGLYQPQSAKNNQPCVAMTRIATVAGTRAYVLVRAADSSSRSTAQAACSCENA